MPEILLGNHFGCFLRRGVPDPALVCRMPFQIYRSRRKAQIRQKTNLYYW